MGEGWKMKIVKVIIKKSDEVGLFAEFEYEFELKIIGDTSPEVVIKTVKEYVAENFKGIRRIVSIKEMGDDNILNG